MNLSGNIRFKYAKNVNDGDTLPDIGEKSGLHLFVSFSI